MVGPVNQPLHPEPVDDPTESAKPEGHQVEHPEPFAAHVEMMSPENSKRRGSKGIGITETHHRRHGVHSLLPQSLVGGADQRGKTKGVDQPTNAEETAGEGVGHSPSPVTQVVVVYTFREK